MATNSRLLALGLLAGEGPMHGHQIRRRAELVDVGEWGDVPIGSLYGALHRMAAEGLVEPVRREQAGNFPERTVYAITEAGRSELTRLWRQALEKAQLHSEAADVALLVAAGSDEPELRDLLAARMRGIDDRLQRMRGEREHLTRNGWLKPATLAIFRHWEHRLEAELRWHDELAGLVAPIAKEKANPGSFLNAVPVTEPTKPRRSPRARAKKQK